MDLKHYELTNHLGNVHGTVSDRTIRVTEEVEHNEFDDDVEGWTVDMPSGSTVSHDAVNNRL